MYKLFGKALHTMYSTACGKDLIFSCPVWIFNFFHATKPPNSHGFCVELHNFHASCGKFSREIWGWSCVIHEVCCIYLNIDLFKKISRVKLPFVAGKVAWVTHESCMCLAWKVVFSVHLPVSQVQRKTRTFLQAVLYAKPKWKATYLFFGLLAELSVLCRVCENKSKNFIVWQWEKDDKVSMLVRMG